MKNIKQSTTIKFRSLFLLICFSISIIVSFNLFSILLNPNEISVPLGKEKNMDDLINSNEFIYTLNGQDYIAEIITDKNLGSLKYSINSTVTERDHEPIIIDGHGTGYRIPLKEDLDILKGKTIVKNVIERNSIKTSYASSIDLSKDIYFPIVGDQRKQGSCVAWANTYYAYGYLEARDNGWDASSGNLDYLLSPAWAYNKLVSEDLGTIPFYNAELIMDWGVCTFSNLPYDDSNIDKWGNEAAWREAPYHKPLDYTFITYNGDSTIELIKSLLESGTPVTFCIDAFQFKWMETFFKKELGYLIYL
ncbi:MAG: hypothetical protein JXA99_07965 [Candidatus Lokiarchaeota archaeon]|nr:hypothetical protein [Candidatus Lokiarchaeota archaeon]